LPSNYAIIQKAFKASGVHNKVVDTIISELDKGKGTDLQPVIDKLKSSTDSQVRMGSLLLINLDKDLKDTQPELIAIAQGKAPPAPSRTQPTPEQQAAALQDSHNEFIATLEQQVAAAMPQLDANEIQKNIDAMISKSAADKYTKAGAWLADLSWAKKLSGEVGGPLPSDDDRAKLAQLMTTVPGMVDKAINHELETNPGSINSNTIIKESIDQFNTAFAKKINDGSLPAVWADHLKEIDAGLKSQLHDKMDHQILEFAEMIKRAPAGTVAGYTAPQKQNDTSHNFVAAQTPLVPPQSQGQRQSI
jgi:hypothetical protein